MSSLTLGTAVRLLSRRDHSAFELKQKLLLRNYPLNEIDAAIVYCFDNDWLNEQRFAASLLHSGVAKGHGLQRIIQDAKQKGIDLNLLELAQKNSPQNWFELAKALAIKRFGDLNGQLPAVNNKERARQFRYLQYRGFSFDEINYALSTEVD